MSGNDRDQWDAQDQRFPIVELTEWYLVSRYPGLDEVALTISDVTVALAWVSDFMTVVRGYGPPESIEGC